MYQRALAKRLWSYISLMIKSQLDELMKLYNKAKCFPISSGVTNCLINPFGDSAVPKIFRKLVCWRCKLLAYVLGTRSDSVQKSGMLQRRRGLCESSSIDQTNRVSKVKNS